jgi:hypothetical protein
MIVVVLVAAAVVIAGLLFGDRFRYRLVRLKQDRKLLRRRHVTDR